MVFKNLLEIKIKIKIKINMVIPVFRGSKGENLEIFLKEYIRICIGTGLGTVIKWFSFS